MRIKLAQAKSNPIPAYYLYGNDALDEDLDTLHAEPIRVRSREHDWTIHPHVHPDHTQILWISEGSATFKIEETQFSAHSNSIVIQPAGMIHEIHFQPGTEGRVLTVAISFIERVIGDDARIIDILRTPAGYQITDANHTNNIRHAMNELLNEANTTALGRRIAVRAHFLAVLTTLLRVHAAHSDHIIRKNSKDFQLVSRYREALEKHFRDEKTLPFYAKSLGVSTQRLNAACKTRAGKTASEALYDRIITEAKRGLLYTEMTVAEIGHSIGFDDPAYFNRFFSQRVGTPPGTYRADAATTRRIGHDGSSNTNL
jgi:AraC family transcriptional activator of pobA